MKDYCVQYRCPPNMLEWQVWEWDGKPYHYRSGAEALIQKIRASESDQTVEYRIAEREISKWKESK